MPSGPLLLVASALLASPLPPAVEVDRSPRELRAVDIAANGASFAIAVARRGGVFVTVDDKDPARVFEWSRQVAIAPAGDGFLVVSPISVGNGFWHEKARRLDAAGAPLEAPRLIRQKAGDAPKDLRWASNGREALVLAGTYYHPLTTWRVPVAPGAAPTALDFAGDLARKQPHRVLPLGVHLTSDGVADILWRIRREDGPMSRTRIATDGTASTTRMDLVDDILGAWFDGQRWIIARSLEQPSARLRRSRVRLETLSERDGRLVAERHGRTRLHRGCGVWHGDRLLWLGHTGRGAKRRVELRAIGLDGADRGGPWVIEPDAGPPHDDTALQRRPGERCLAVTETDVVAVWTVMEGNARVLRRRAVPRRLVEAPGEAQRP